MALILAGDNHMRIETSRSRICIISSFPPSKCGLATYADEQAKRLSEDGRVVEKVTFSPDSDADRHFDFQCIAGLISWLYFCWTARFDAVYVHYADTYYFPPCICSRWMVPLFRMIQGFALRCLSRSAGKTGTLIIHELVTAGAIPARARLYKNMAMGGFARVGFHTTSSREEAIKTYSSLTPKNTSLIDHANFMRKKYSGTQREARVALALPDDDCIFLCIGFIAPQKGFDRAIEAFAVETISNAGIYVVGSVHPTSPFPNYTKALKNKIGNVPHAHFVEEYVSDDLFDCWLQAADAVILPYRSVNSSGAGARATLFNKKVIISDIPNLWEQFPEATVFRDEEELASILRDISGRKTADS